MPTIFSAFLITLVVMIFLPITLLYFAIGSTGCNSRGAPCTMMPLSLSEPILAPPPPRAQIALMPPMMPAHSTWFSPAVVMRASAMSSRSVQLKSRSMAAGSSRLSMPT